ncbi:MAG: hypothetical protein E7254_01565 [Lachnospiraceae bacterium]|nr:hypothetical protein [Lachnospiraceae bacterium]
MYGFIFSPLLKLFVESRRKNLVNRRKKQLKYQFKDAINSLSDLLAVGYSVENAIKECYKEMMILHGKDSLICRELKVIIKKIELNIPVELALQDFGKRSGVGDIKLFGQIFYNAKRTGGNLVSVIKLVSSTISQSFDVEEEVAHIIGEKKLESHIMNVAPVAVLAYATMTGGGMFDVMYETMAGHIFMTGCLLVYIAVVCLSSKIIQIECD